MFESWLCHLQAVELGANIKMASVLIFFLICKMEITTSVAAVSTHTECERLSARVMCKTAHNVLVFLLPLEYLVNWAISGWPFSSLTPLSI